MLKSFRGPALLLAAVTSLLIVRPAGAQDRSIWDNWYTVTVNGMAYSYYNDQVQLKKGRLYYQTRTWKKDGDDQAQEMLAGFSLNDAAVTPLYSKFMHRGGQTSRKIVATARQSGTIEVRTETNNSSRSVNARLEKGSILSNFFPVWLGRNMSRILGGSTASFTAVFENGLNPDFKPVPGAVRQMAEDDFAKSTRTEKLEVSYGDVSSVWYVRGSGLPVRIDLPEQKTTIELVARSQAESFLK